MHLHANYVHIMYMSMYMHTTVQYTPVNTCTCRYMYVQMSAGHLVCRSLAAIIKHLHVKNVHVHVYVHVQYTPVNSCTCRPTKYHGFAVSLTILARGSRSHFDRAETHYSSRRWRRASASSAIRASYAAAAI